MAKKNTAAVALGRKRWAGKTVAERKAFGAMLAQARKKAQAKKQATS